MSQTTVLIAKPSPILRGGLRAIIETASDMLVVGEAADGLSALHLVQKLKPSILITSLRLPRLDGLEVIRQAAHSSPDTQIIIISPHVDQVDVADALRAGAKGFLHLDSTASDILQCINEVKAGNRFLGSIETQAVLEAVSGQGTFDLYELLTPREREVLQLSAEGLKRPAIAKKLFISERTVETHRANLMQKLTLHSQTDLVRFAIRKGLVAA